MTLADVKQHIEEYFANADPQEVILEFEEMGCVFEPLSEFENKLIDMGYVLNFDLHPNDTYLDGILTVPSLLHTANYQKSPSQGICTAAGSTASYAPMSADDLNELLSTTPEDNSNLLYTMAA